MTEIVSMTLTLATDLVVTQQQQQQHKATGCCSRQEVVCDGQPHNVLACFDNQVLTSMYALFTREPKLLKCPVYRSATQGCLVVVWMLEKAGSESESRHGYYHDGCGGLTASQMRYDRWQQES